MFLCQRSFNYSTSNGSEGETNQTILGKLKLAFQNTLHGPGTMIERGREKTVREKRETTEMSKRMEERLEATRGR